MTHTDKYKKLKSNIVLITVGNFASKILGFLFIPLYTSVLTTSEYGVADLIVTTVSLLFPIFTLVICEAMMRFALENKDNQNDIWIVGLWVWAFGFLALLVLSPLLNYFQNLAPYKSLLLLYYVSYSLNFNASYFVRGIEKVKLYTVSGILQTFFTIVLNLVFLLGFRIGLSGYLLSYIISNFLTSLVLILGSGVYKTKLSPPKPRLLKEMLMFSIPLIPNQIGWLVNQSADKYFLLAICGTSVMGIYSVAHKIPSILYVLISIFSSAWRISSVDGYGTEENAKFYNTIYDKYMTVSFVAASCLISLNKILARLLYANDFYAAYAFVPTLILAVLFNGLGEFIGSIYITYKKTKSLMTTTLIGTAVNIALNMMLIPILGGIGAALATMIGFITLWAIRCFDSRKILKIKHDYVRSSVCILLLLIQTGIWLVEFPYALLANLVITGMVIYIRRDIVEIVIKKIKYIERK